jgi:hypothetical protein
MPDQKVPRLRDGYNQEQIETLDLEAARIRPVIWASGYNLDFSLVKLPVTDGDRCPIQLRGVTAFDDCYFLDMPWLDSRKSGMALKAVTCNKVLSCLKAMFWFAEARGSVAGNARPVPPREAAEEQLRGTRRVPHLRGVRASEGEFSGTS